jgi:hypothetical protein
LKPLVSPIRAVTQGRNCECSIREHLRGRILDEFGGQKCSVRPSLIQLMASMSDEDVRRTTQKVDVRLGWLRHSSNGIDEWHTAANSGNRRLRNVPNIATRAHTTSSYILNGKKNQKVEKKEFSTNVRGTGSRNSRVMTW